MLPLLKSDGSRGGPCTWFWLSRSSGTVPIMSIMGPVQTRGKRNCYRFIFALFLKGSPRDQPRKAPGEGGGTRALRPLSGLFLRESSRVAVSFLGGRFAN